MFYDEQLSKSCNYIKEKIYEDYKNLRLTKANKRRRRKKRVVEDEKISYLNPIKSLDIDNI